MTNLGDKASTGGATDPGEVSTTGAPARHAVDNEVLTRLACLDISAAQSRYARTVDADAPYYLLTNVSMEYRRFLLLRLTYPDLTIPAPPLIDRYWRLHAEQPTFASEGISLAAAAGVSPKMLVPPPQPSEYPPGRQIRDLYGATFPCGDADLWGWPALEPDRRNSAPGLGLVLTQLPSAFDEFTRSALHREAFEQRSSATEGHSTTCNIERGSVHGGFGGYCYAEAGPVLDDVHWNGVMSRFIAAEHGAIVAPAGAYYNYHRSGDSSSLHTDPYAAELTLLTLLSGPVEPLYCHPELADAPWEEIRSLAMATHGHPEGGIPCEISPTSVLFSGQAIPHHRKSVERYDEVVVVAQFFGSLLP